MSFLSDLLNKRAKGSISIPSGPLSQECKQLLELNNSQNEILHSDHYVSRREYIDLFEMYKDTVEYFEVLINSGMLTSYCSQQHFNESIVTETISTYKNLTNLVDLFNENYINQHLVDEKEYLDNILHDVDPVINLDTDQRKVILSDEDYSLVIAGAGAGKTTTVAAKVKYLVERQNIEPKDILVISFTNKAVGELRDKINKDLNFDCPIATFHSTGNAILHINNPEPLNIAEASKLYFLLVDYFKNTILKNESLVNNLILFFASYFDAPYEGSDLNEFFNKIAKTNFVTMRGELEDFKREVMDRRSKKMVTIRNEILRSHQEVEIANFLYLNNIDYEYEPIYKYRIMYSRKPYTPDFIIKQDDKEVYIEHFGISEDGINDRFSPEELEMYKKSVNDKIILHRKHGTKLIYTFSKYKDNRPLTEHLQEQLEKAGFVLNRRSNEEIMEKLISTEESHYIRRLIALISRFINNFKTNGYSVEEFDRMYHSTKNVRSKLFLNICQDCYLEYERYLKENNAVDFEDMINESARILKEIKEMKQRLHFKYIIVDEYQDISRQRFDLTTALSEVCDAKIIAVGDDWQSIYAFSGSDITLFTKFSEKMGYAKLLKIERTYRNAQEVIDIAGNFIQKNPTQITKTLVSPKTITDPVIIYTYDTDSKRNVDDRRSGSLYAQAKAVEIALDQIVEFNKAEGKSDVGSVLLLGRFNFDGHLFENTGLFEYRNRGNILKSLKYPKMKLTFMTVHMSKGLGYDNVIVLNGKNEIYGFPSKIQDDPVLQFVIKGDNSIDYAEERRLFYVAMTRTKNRVFFIAPEKNPSEFLLELKHDYKNVLLKGTWNEENSYGLKSYYKKCPICGYPMQYKYKNAYGLRLYICTNEPEICGFMTNEIGGGKLSIIKCESCNDGYLIVKKSGNDYFLGCTNFKKDKTGCNHTMSMEDYNAQRLFTDIVPHKFAEEYKENIKEQNAIEKPQASTPSISPTASETMPENQFNDTISNETPIYELTVDYTKKLGTLSKVMYKNYQLTNILQTVLDCEIHISEDRFFNTETLIQVLIGGNSDKIKKYELYIVPEYRTLNYLSVTELMKIIEWSLANHFLLETKGRNPVLHPTYETLNYLESITKPKLEKLKDYLENNELSS